MFPILSRSGYLRRTTGEGPAVVTYHGVFPTGYQVRHPSLDGNLVHANSLRSQLQLLTKRYNVITPNDFLRWLEGDISLPPRSVLLTCDDALRNALKCMVPILQQHGLSCLFFATGISTDKMPAMLWHEELYLMLLQAKVPLSLSLPEAGINIGPIMPTQRHASWWNLVEQLSRFDKAVTREFLDQIREQLGLSEDWRQKLLQDSSVADRFLTLDRADLKRLAMSGMVIGAHSLSHPILSRAPENLARREIFESKTVLEKVLNQPVWALAYPFGNAATVTKREVRAADQSGFRCAFMNEGGGFGAKINRLTVPRVHVTAHMSVPEFEAHLVGFYRTLRKKLLGENVMEAVIGA